MAGKLGCRNRIFISRRMLRSGKPWVYRPQLKRTLRAILKCLLHYKRALEQGVRDEALFQNYGALLKSQANSDEAEKIYQRGLAIHPKSHAIMRNYANLLRANSKPAASAELYFRVLRIL